MPIVGPNTWLPTVNDFIAHWTEVNASLGATPLVLKGTYTLANFTTDRDALQTSVNTLTQRTVERETASANRDIQKNALRPALTRFRAAVQNALQGTSYARSLPKLPTLTANESRYLAPFQATLNLWTTINNLGAAVPGFTPPLILGDGTTLAAYTTALSTLRGTFRTLDTADANLRIARERRNDLFPPLRLRLNQYRNAVLDKFGPGHALVDSLPALSPPAGSTPAPVTLNGTWNPATGKAVLTWPASPDPRLDHYSLRTTGSAPYKAAEETVLAIVPKGQNQFATDAGLAVSGAFANFKVYVVTTNGNERGSNAVKVTRP